MSEVTIVKVAPQMVLGIRKFGKYKKISRLLGRLFMFSARHGLEITGPPMFICHEESESAAKEADKKGKADLEVAVPIKGEFQDVKDLRKYELPGGSMAKIIHKGPYENCKAAYDKLFAWVQENNKELIGPTREVYLNDPREVRADEILTEIYAPVK